ncbi:MAG: hypothetical protein KDA78_12940 [Planctomycetaceae bacterium]|nr:hypothetical protein [Planctomycetaceae bacterium]
MSACRVLSVLFVWSLCLQCSFQASAEEELRTWKDRSGSYEIKARFVAETDGKVTLKLEDNSEVEIEVDKLSLGDQIAIRSIKKRMAEDDNPFKSKTKSDSPFMPKSGSSSSSSGSTTSLPEESVPTAGKVVDENFTNAAMVELVPVSAESWSYEPDTVEMPFADHTKPIPFPNKSSIHERFGRAVANSARTHFVLSRTLTGFGRDPDKTTIMLTEMEKDRFAGHGSIDGYWEPVDLSAGGKQILLKSTNRGSNGDLEVQVLALGQKGLEPVVSWKPYLHGDNNRRNVEWAAFLGTDRIITLSQNDELVVWSYPDVAPISQVKLKNHSHPVVSPGGKHLIFYNDGEICFLNTETLQTVASISTPNLHGTSLAINAAGTRLAALQGNQLYVWDLATGELYRDMKLSVMTAFKPMAWVDDNLLVVGGSNLVDVDKRIQLWEFSNSDFAIGGQGNCWFYVSNWGNRKPGWMNVKLPHPQTDQALNAAISDGTYFAIQPGTEMKVTSNGFDDSSKAGECQKALEDALRNAGYKITDNAAVTVELSVTRGESRTINYRMFGGGEEQVNFTPYISTARYMLDGKEIWKSSTGNYAPMMLHMKQGETVAEHVKGYEKPNYDFFGKSEIPSYVPRPREDGSNTLGKSELVIR